MTKKDRIYSVTYMANLIWGQVLAKILIAGIERVFSIVIDPKIHILYGICCLGIYILAICNTRMATVGGIGISGLVYGLQVVSKTLEPFAIPEQHLIGAIGLSLIVIAFRLWTIRELHKPQKASVTVETPKPEPKETRQPNITFELTKDILMGPEPTNLVTCPQCGKGNYKGVPNCSGCGASLADVQ